MTTCSHTHSRLTAYTSDARLLSPLARILFFSCSSSRCKAAREKEANNNKLTPRRKYIKIDTHRAAYAFDDMWDRRRAGEKQANPFRQINNWKYAYESTIFNINSDDIFLYGKSEASHGRNKCQIERERNQPNVWIVTLKTERQQNKKHVQW